MERLGHKPRMERLGHKPRMERLGQEARKLEAPAPRRAQKRAQRRRAHAWRWRNVLVCCVAAAACGYAGGADPEAIETASASSGQAGGAGAGRSGVDVFLDAGPRGITRHYIADARRQQATGAEEVASADVRAWWEDNWTGKRRWSWGDQDSGHGTGEKGEQDDDDSVRPTKGKFHLGQKRFKDAMMNGKSHITTGFAPPLRKYPFGPTLPAAGVAVKGQGKGLWQV